MTRKNNNVDPQTRIVKILRDAKWQSAPVRKNVNWSPTYETVNPNIKWHRICAFLNHWLNDELKQLSIVHPSEVLPSDVHIIVFNV